MKMFANRAAAILWVIWGLVHIAAGVLTLVHVGADAVGGIADAVDPATLVGTYAAATDAIINQHGFNLAWIGLTTVVCAPFVWRGSLYAMLMAAVVGGLADVGYLLFLDLGGFVHFVPGTVMTIVSASAVILSIVSWRLGESASA